MIRALCLLALTACITIALIRTTGVQILSAAEATPAASLPTDAAFEIANSVPVSIMIRNDSDHDDRLLGGSTPVARRVEVHRTRLVEGQRHMHAATDGIAIPANQTLILEPGSNHLMLLGLHVDLVQGETFPLTLRFARAGETTVTARVRRKVDAAGLTPFPSVVVGDLSLALASAPPAPAGTPIPSHDQDPD